MLLSKPTWTMDLKHTADAQITGMTLSSSSVSWFEQLVKTHCRVSEMKPPPENSAREVQTQVLFAAHALLAKQGVTQAGTGINNEAKVQNDH